MNRRKRPLNWHRNKGLMLKSIIKDMMVLSEEVAATYGFSSKSARQCRMAILKCMDVRRQLDDEFKRDCHAVYDTGTYFAGCGEKLMAHKEVK